MAKYASDPHYRDFIRSSGVAIENIVHERMTGLYGSVSSKNTVAFFNGTMLTPWTNTQREMAGAVGYEWFKSEFNRAVTNFNPTVGITQQNRTFKKAPAMVSTTLFSAISRWASAEAWASFARHKFR